MTPDERRRPTTGTDTPFGFGSRRWLGDHPWTDDRPPRDTDELRRSTTNPRARSMIDPPFPGTPRHRIIKAVNDTYHDLAPEEHQFAHPLAIPADDPKVVV